MPRQLKTYITNLGFFELAIAAPSMKAALDAWGMSHNAFQRGFAKQTGDTAIIAATMALPGVVLKRAVGSKGEFKENADLPKSLPAIKAPKFERRIPKLKAAPKAKPDSNSKTIAKADRAAILSFKKAQEKRNKERAEEERRLEHERAKRRRAIDEAEAALEDAQEEHEAAMAAIEREREKLDRRAEHQTERWEAQRKKLSAAVERSQK